MSISYIVSFLIVFILSGILIVYKKTKAKFIVEVRENENLKKWSSVGQMAGGIAHEVNTPLTTMLLVLECLDEKLQNNEIAEARKDVLELLYTAKKIRNIVHSLRLLTMTGGKFERDRVCLFDTILHVKKEFSKQIEENNINFVYMYNIKSKGEVWGSSAALKHVLTNLVKNAIDAVQNHEEKWVKVFLIENKTHYKLMVQNAGPPINKEIAEKIFEPFFTTKDIGQAMGIGLSISKTLVLVHGGKIKLDMNNPHVLFEVSLPKIKEEIKPKKLKTAA